VVSGGTVLGVKVMEDKCGTVKTTVCRIKNRVVDDTTGDNRSDENKKMMPAAAIEEEYQYGSCCPDENGLHHLNMSVPDPATCSTSTCDVQEGWVEAAWVTTQHFPGCGCCEVEGKIVPDGFSWSTGTSPVQTWECCRGRIVLVNQSSSSTSTPVSTSSITIPAPLCKNASELVDDSIMFIAGGNTTNVTILGDNLQTKSLKPFPERTSAPALAYHEGAVYLCGKVFARTPEEHKCKKYNREANKWTDIQNFPYINEHGQAESVNGNLYVFGGSGGERNVVKYNSNEDSWTVLPAKIPFNFTRGCSAVVSDCRVFLMNVHPSFALFVIFDAVSETFEERSGIDTIANMKRCSAVLGKVNNTVGLMVAVEREKTFFTHHDPSSQWEEYPTKHIHVAPLLGRVSNNAMVLGGFNGNEFFQNLSPSWENMAANISFHVIGYQGSTQVPKSWFE